MYNTMAPRGSSLVFGVLMMHALMAGPQQAMAAEFEMTPSTIDRDAAALDPYPVTQVAAVVDIAIVVSGARARAGPV